VSRGQVRAEIHRTPILSLLTIERKTGAERLQTARPERNYRHVTELTYSQEGNTGSSRSPREMINLTAISLSSGAARSCHGHKHITASVFCHCVKMLLGSFEYIVIFLCKISTLLSGFGFILCRKKRRLKCCIVCTDKRADTV